MDWRIVQYNPLSLLPAGRLQHILCELGMQHFVGICGTGHRAKSTDPAFTSYKCGKYWVYDFPARPKSQFAIHGAGVCIAISSKTFSPRNVVSIADVPEEFAGRVAAIRVRRQDVDFLFVAVYVPVEPHKTTDRNKIAKLWEYLYKLLNNIPSRCVPVICIDANGRVGSQTSDSIGPCDSQRENSNGKQLRELCEHHHLCLVNTFYPIGHTWRGEYTSSRIDYIAIPKSMLQRVGNCRIFHRSGALLQKIAAPGWRDHRPLHCSFTHKLCYANDGRTKGVRWNWELLARGVFTGARRHELLGNVEAALADSKLDELSRGPPGPFWKLLTKKVHEVAEGLYGQQPSSSSKPSDTVNAYSERVSKLQAIIQLSPGRIRWTSEGYFFHDLQRMLHAWVAVAKFWKARKHHEDLLKRDRRARISGLLQTFQHAWSSRKASDLWRAARSLSGRALGPKRRRFDVPLSSQPTVAQWESHFKQDGPSGGCLAAVLDGSEAFFTGGNNFTPVCETQEAISRAKLDVHMVRAAIRKHPMRKSVPSWGVPAEVWRQLLHPADRAVRLRNGVGHRPACPPTTQLERRFLQGFTSIRRFERAPEIWQLSQTHKINKGNGKEGCKALRTINSLDCIGKCFYKYIWRRGTHHSARYYAYGYAKGRSRIEAMVVQHVVSERLRTAGFSFVTSFHEIANAFPSMQHNHIQTATDAVVKDADRNLLRQRIGETAMVVEASDGRVVVSPKCGTLQGDSIAGDVFTEGYHSILDAWNARLHGLGPPFRITAFSPFDLSDQDLAVTAYADDVCRKILVSSPQTASVRVQQSNAILDEELAKATMAQNVDKQQHIAVFKGTNSRRYTKYITQHGMQDGTAVFQARYLGGLQRFDGQCGPEIEVRAQAAYVSWCTFKGLWHRRELPRRGLRSVFLGMVYEVLLAGVDALVLGRRHYDKLDRIVTAYGRRLMRGTACEKTEDEHGQIHYRSVSNSAVFRYLGIASSRVELRIRRLKFLQRLARDPCKHHQVITAIFGTMFFDAEPTIQSDGGLSTYANSYAKTYWEDIQALQSLDSAYWLVDMANREVLPFFSELAEEFVHVDVSELRAQELSVSIPPPRLCA